MIREFYSRRILPSLIRRASRVVTVSHASARDITSLVGVPEERISVIPPGFDPSTFHPRPRDEAQRRVAEAVDLRAPYLVYVSRLEHPAKNHVRLIEAFRRLKESTALPHELLLVGPDWNGAEVVHAAVAAAGVPIRCLGFVEEGLLPWIYAAADLCVFPSLREGFGLPVLEAMASGTPVACADATSLPEVAGGAAALFSPSSTSGMAAVLGGMLNDPFRRRWHAAAGLRRANHFSWSRTAHELVEVCSGAANERNRRVATVTA
jgi:glycosyltransferase involved in cell wall biosynthesis